MEKEFQRKNEFFFDFPLDKYIARAIYSPHERSIMAEFRYVALSAELERYIRENDLHGRLPGIAKLAAVLQVNHITLRKAIKLLAERNILTVIPNEGTFIVEKSPLRKKYHVLGFVGFPLAGELAQELFEELNSHLASGAYRAINIVGSPVLFAERPELLLKFPVDGFSFFGSNITRSIAEKLLEEKIPAVCSINSNFSEFNHVGMDHIAGYSKGIEMLRERGCRKIAFLDFQRKAEFQNYHEDIRRVFQEKLKEEFDEELFTLYDPLRFKERFLGNFRMKCVEESLKKWENNMPDAVITSQYFVPFFREKALRLTILEFASHWQKDCSMADITFLEDAVALLRESTRLLLEALEGSTEKKEIRIPFQIKINNTHQRR